MRPPKLPALPQRLAAVGFVMTIDRLLVEAAAAIEKRPYIFSPRIPKIRTPTQKFPAPLHRSRRRRLRIGIGVARIWRAPVLRVWRAPVLCDRKSCSLGHGRNPWLRLGRLE